MKKLLTLSSALLSAGVCFAAAPPATQRNFVTCPIVRDTATVPCWVAEYKGELYYIGIQTDISAEWYPPYLGHQVLVEGTVSDEPRICGGIVLKPNKISVLPEMDPSCNRELPAEAQYTVPFAPRGPGPSKGSLAFGNVRQAPPPPPTPPYQPKEFVVPYEFDARAVTGRTGRVMQQAVRYAQLVKASSVEVTGYRGSVLLSDGKLISEMSDIAEVRAKEVGGLLQAVGISVSTLKVKWKGEAESADGVRDFDKRRVTIVVKP